MIEIEDLLQKIEEGRFALPEVQRPYVWKNKQVRDLLESIYRGYPIGSIIVWNLPRSLANEDSEYFDLFRPLAKDLENRKNNFEYLVIDGQQRLVSLYLVKKGTIKVYYEDKEHTRTINLCFNPITNELKVLNSKKQEGSEWFSVTKLLQDDIDIDDLLDEKGFSNGTKRRKLRKSLGDFRKRVCNYKVNIYEIPSKTLRYDPERDNFLEIFEEISEMFIRLNEKGTRVKMTHLLTALLTAKTRKDLGESFKKKLWKITEDLENKGWDLKEGVIMRTYMAVSTGDTRFTAAKKALANIPTKRLQDYLDSTHESLRKTIEILEKELNIRAPKYLKSQYILVPLAYYVNKKGNITPSDIKEIKRWFILASFSRRYTGALESSLEADINILKEGKTLRDLEENLPVKEITYEHLDSSYNKEHISALLILLKDSYDFNEKEPTTKISEIETKSLHIHHIFPRDLLVKYYGRSTDIETLLDDVANITIISEEANKRISSKRPDEYLSKLDKETLESHYIPDDPSLWKPENYYEFLEERRKRLLEGIKRIMGH